MNTSASLKRSPLTFFVLVFALALPFWLLGALVTPIPPINLSVSSLQVVCPLIAACILVYREERLGGIKRLLKRVFDFKRIRQKIWYVPIIFLNPLILLLSYGVMLLLGRPLPEQPYIPFLMLPIFFVVFFLAAVGEEVGWTGYATDPMQDRWSALKTGIIIGSVWAIWHVVGFRQEHQWAWVAGQCFSTIVLRVLIVWIYNNTGKSMFAAILFHAMSNVSEFSFPNYGSHYDPAITGAIQAVIAVIVTFLWGSKTLARYRYVRVPQSDRQSGGTG
jgi:CAAX protease family protein